MDDRVKIHLDEVLFSGPAKKMYNAISDYWKLKSLDPNARISLVDVFFIHYSEKFLANAIRTVKEQESFRDLYCEEPEIQEELDREEGHITVLYKVYCDE